MGENHMKNILTIPGQILLEQISSKTPPAKNVGKDMVKKEPSYTVGGNVT
jgi:hypothetical protein